MIINSFDLETTGKDPATARIWQAAITCSHRADSWQHFINPEESIPDEIINLCHVDNRMMREIENADNFKSHAENGLIYSLKGCDLLIGHNIIAYDLPVLAAECERAGLELGELPPVLDTAILAREIWPNLLNHKLLTIYTSLYEEHSWIEAVLGDPVADIHTSAHGARFDTALTMAIFRKIVEPGLSVQLCDALVLRVGRTTLAEILHDLVRYQAIAKEIQEYDTREYGKEMDGGGWFKWLRTCRNCLISIKDKGPNHYNDCETCNGYGAVMHTKTKRGQAIEPSFARWALGKGNMGLPKGVREKFKLATYYTRDS